MPCRLKVGTAVSRHRVTITVNGERRQAEVESRKLLVHFLRDDLGVTSTHVGCDTSQCGACTVHLDGGAVKSCTVLAVQADGAAVNTVESLRKPGEAEHPLQSAFREHHALQCGFCTPGMIMSSLELLRREPHPTEERIRTWLKGNFCRCTGYQHIVDAIRAAGEATRPQDSPGVEQEAAGTAATEARRFRAGQADRFFGQPLARREDDRHLRGLGRFTDDVRPANAARTLHVALARSPHAHARIRSVSTDRAVRIPGVVAAVTGANLLDGVSPLPANWILP